MNKFNLVALILCLGSDFVFTKKIRKRQLFREQLLPYMGGKIPEAAFQTDRLALNQLNARGIYSTSGVYLEHYSDKASTGHHHVKTMQIPVPLEDRYVAPEGRYHYHTPPTLDTTYVIREPVQVPITPNLCQHPQPQLPYGSLKLAGYYKDMRQRGYNLRGPAQDAHHTHNKDTNDVDDFEAHAKNEYEPYLKKLHELDK